MGKKIHILNGKISLCLNMILGTSNIFIYIIVLYSKTIILSFSGRHLNLISEKFISSFQTNLLYLHQSHCSRKDLFIAYRKTCIPTQTHLLRISTLNNNSNTDVGDDGLAIVLSSFHVFTHHINFEIEDTIILIL